MSELFSLTDVFEMFKVVSMNFTLGLLQPVYWGAIFLIYILYKRMVNSEYSTVNQMKSSPGEMLFESVMYGILIGYIASLIVNFTGIYIHIDNNSLLFIWAAVLILGFINVRYVCFSYAGGILALMNLLVGWPVIDVSGLLALVGLLHLCEAFMMWSQGAKNPVPIFVRHKEKVVGAFSVQKFWPIPIALMIVSIVLSSDMPAEVVNINTPDWWPLMKQPDVPENKSLLFSILAIPAVLGYSDVVITNRPEIKVKKSATFLSFYSIILIVLAVASSHVYIMKYVAAVFAIAAHELLVLYWIRKEKYGSPYFSVPEKGIRVLDVVKDGPADKMRILPGDIILRVNNEDVMTYQEITTLLRDYPNYIWLEILRDNKKTVTLEYQSYRERVNDLQLLYVPRDGHAANVIHITEIISPIQRIFRK